MKLIYIICFVLLLSSCAMTSPYATKINGVSYVASRDSISVYHVTPLTTINANYASVMPFGFIRELSHPQIQYNSNRQWFGETIQGTKQYIEVLKQEGISIMMKPQIWVWRGEFTGEIKMKNDADWKLLEDSYTQFILDYAKLAEETKVEIFCIGTELEKFIENRPGYWFSLIKKIRNLYKGQLTYAANWNEFNRTPFWKMVDYIGVNAYFPISKSKTPTFEECLKGWQTHKQDIKNVNKAYNKPILFTEYGYRSVDYSGKEPWKSDTSMNEVNLEAQNHTTHALFETFWDEDWFAGGFIWKWFINHEKSGGHDNAMFTPQNKPVSKIIRDFYSKH